MLNASTEELEGFAQELNDLASEARVHAVSVRSAKEEIYFQERLLSLSRWITDIAGGGILKPVFCDCPFFVAENTYTEELSC